MIPSLCNGKDRRTVSGRSRKSPDPGPNLEIVYDLSEKVSFDSFLDLSVTAFDFRSIKRASPPTSLCFVNNSFFVL